MEDHSSRLGDHGRYPPQANCRTVKAGDIKQMQTLVDDSLEHRLVLEYVAVEIPTLENGGFGLDFYALRLQTSRNGAWNDELTISQNDFLAESTNRRWIAKIHSFDSKNRVAIIQTGTEASPSGIGAVQYCWCEWDLGRNCLVRNIKICENPFDPLDDQPAGENGG